MTESSLIESLIKEREKVIAQIEALRKLETTRVSNRNMFKVKNCKININMQNNLSWFGTVTSVIGSFTVALGFMLAGYAAFILGSVSWLIVGFVGKNKPLIVLNSFFLAANLIGVYRAVV